jgi:hypothetical protein
LLTLSTSLIDKKVVRLLALTSAIASGVSRVGGKLYIDSTIETGHMTSVYNTGRLSDFLAAQPATICKDEITGQVEYTKRVFLHSGLSVLRKRMLGARWHNLGNL